MPVRLAGHAADWRGRFVKSTCPCSTDSAPHVFDPAGEFSLAGGISSPPSARVTIQNYVMRLRKALGDTGTSRIGTLPSGYAIQADAGELDVAGSRTC